MVLEVIIRTLRKIRYYPGHRTVYTIGLMLCASLLEGVVQNPLHIYAMFTLVGTIVLLWGIELILPLYSRKEFQIERLYGIPLSFIMVQHATRIAINVSLACIAHAVILDLINSLSIQFTITELDLFLVYTFIFLNLFCVSIVRTLIQLRSPIERPD